jgi:Cu/Ag efflux protein CusF
MKKLLALSILAAAGVFATAHSFADAPTLMRIATAYSAVSAQGVIESYDVSSLTIQIAHDAIPALDLSKGTTLFHVKERALLVPVNPHDAVTLTITRDGKDLLVTGIAKR